LELLVKEAICDQLIKHPERERALSTK